MNHFTNGPCLRNLNQISDNKLIFHTIRNPRMNIRLSLFIPLVLWNLYHPLKLNSNFSRKLSNYFSLENSSSKSQLISSMKRTKFIGTANVFFLHFAFYFFYFCHFILLLFDPR